MLVYWIVAVIVILILSACFYAQKNTVKTRAITNYEIYSQDPFYQPSSYPLNKRVSSSLYKSIGTWTGRLILLETETGFVYFEIYHAALSHQNLIGKTVKLKWRNYNQTISQDVRFTKTTQKSQQGGQLHPERLNNRKNVDSLESLAGARPQDDAIVMLKNPTVVYKDKGEDIFLLIDREPVQISGRFYGLVKIIRRISENHFQVYHYNKFTHQFDALPETICIPQVPPDRDNVLRSTNRELEKSPLNSQGWYIYGAKNTDGIFVVQAIEPRTILRLKPDLVRLGLKAGKHHIKRKIWQKTAAKKGTTQTVLLDPIARNKTEAIAKWCEGDRAIVIHTFGGIGGRKAEPSPFGMVTGHFSYGIAEVIRERLTDELRFDLEYRQIYAHNPDGIVAGTIKWSSYMGDLWRGWLSTRPVCDIIVKFDAVTQDYDFGGIKLSPLTEFTHQLDMMAARYRIGDGTGAAIVTPATSCVQDSNQALFTTIKQIEQEIELNPLIQDWLQNHPNDPQTLRFQQLVRLGRSLEKHLIPLGMVRSDWEEYPTKLEGTGKDNLITTIIKAVTTWRTVMPRQAGDKIATILLNHGASLWIIRTNQIGGYDPDIVPLAPTAFFGNRR